MAEGLLKEKLFEKDYTDIEVGSAGTMTIVGVPPAQNSIVAMQEVDIDIGDQTSSTITPSLIEEADLILTMEAAHSAYIRRLWPESADKVHNLRAYDDGVDEDVADPVGMDLEAYRTCRDILKMEIDRIIESIISLSRK